MRGLAALAVVLHDSATERTKRLRWPWFAVVTAAPVLAMIVIAGSVWTLDHLFWVDMLLGFPAALLLAAAATGRPAPLVRTLNTRRIRSLVSFSYSLYLIHAPIVVVVYAKIVAPHVSAGTPAFLATAAIAGTLSVVAARLFAACSRSRSSATVVGTSCGRPREND